MEPRLIDLLYYYFIPSPSDGDSTGRNRPFRIQLKLKGYSRNYVRHIHVSVCVAVRKIRSPKDVTCVTNTAFGLQTNRLAAKLLACYRPTANEYTNGTGEGHEKQQKKSTERDKEEVRVYATTPNGTQKR